MTYAPLDDTFDDCPKYAERTAAEMGVIACAITYATRNLSDGRVPKVWPGRRFGKEGEKVAARLVEIGVWTVRSDGDFEIDGFLEHNPSREQVLAKRAKKAAAGAAGGAASWATRRKKGEASAEAPASSSASEVMKQTAAGAEPTTDTLQRQIQTQIQDPPNPPTDGSTPVERDRPRRIPRNDIATQREFWVATYKRTVEAARGSDSWIFESSEFYTLVAAIETKCADRTNIDGWIERTVSEFVEWVDGLGDESKFWPSVGPKALVRWLNRPQEPKSSGFGGFKDFTATAAKAPGVPQGASEGKGTGVRVSDAGLAVPGANSTARLPGVG